MKCILKTRHANGLFSAAPATNTGYNRIWIRDNLYTILSLSEKEQIKTIKALLELIKKHEYKLDWIIKQPNPKHGWRYIHPIYNPDGTEIKQEWGWKQNDAIGALLWHVGRHKKHFSKNKKIIQKLVDYLEAIEYWHDKDNGIWEENEEIHASSIGACLAGLISVDGFVNVKLHLIAHGEQALRKLLPRESTTKHADLALLSLIWPYNIVTETEKEQILKNVENELVRNKGLIRYSGDQYYSNGTEAEWTMGFPWLAIIYKQLGKTNKHRFYTEKTKSAVNKNGHLPELYYGGTNKHNENTPLAWAMSLWRIAK